MTFWLMNLSLYLSFRTDIISEINKFNFFNPLQHTDIPVKISKKRMQVLPYSLKYAKKTHVINKKLQKVKREVEINQHS